MFLQRWPSCIWGLEQPNKCKSTAKNEADRVKSIFKTNPIIPKTCWFQILKIFSFSFIICFLSLSFPLNPIPKFPPYPIDSFSACEMLYIQTQKFLNLSNKTHMRNLQEIWFFSVKENPINQSLLCFWLLCFTTVGGRTWLSLRLSGLGRRTSFSRRLWWWFRRTCLIGGRGSPTMSLESRRGRLKITTRLWFTTSLKLTLAELSCRVMPMNRRWVCRNGTLLDRSLLDPRLSLVEITKGRKERHGLKKNIGTRIYIDLHTLFLQFTSLCFCLAAEKMVESTSKKNFELYLVLGFGFCVCGFLFHLPGWEFQRFSHNFSDLELLFSCLIGGNFELPS